MLPMRSIPFKVVCLVGMNFDIFPRDSQPLSFDLAARHPKAGDRSRRNDDKYIFLESIISARNTFYISYVGQSVQDNSCLPPSVLVSDMLDTIEKGFELPGEDIRKHVLRFHHLQAFAPEYFKNDDRLFSYSKDNCDAAAFVGGRQEQKPLVTQAMLMTEAEKAQWRDIDIESLCRFFSHPARFLLQNRLGSYLQQSAVITEKREDFDLSSLDQFVVGQKMLGSRLDGSDLNDRQPALMGMGQFPHGNVGKLRYAEIRSEVEQFAGRIEAFKENRVSGPLETQIDIGDFKLRVRLPEIHNSGLIHSRYAKQRAQDLISLWIYHLALCETSGGGGLKISVMLFKDATWQFQPVIRPKAYLAELINMFFAGLEKPLHLFPASSLEFVQQEHKGKSEEQALVLARIKWSGNEFIMGESDDPYFDTCFKMTDPLNESFAKASRSVFEPLLEHGEQMQNDLH